MNNDIDPVILHSILICLVAGDAHLIIRTHKDDISLVTRLVVHTLSSVFDYTTHKLKIRHRPSPPSTISPPPPPTTTPANFLRSLFLASPSSSSRTSQDESSDPNRSRKLRSRSRSRTTMKQRPHSARSISSPADPSHIEPSISEGHHVKATGATMSRGISHAHTDPLPPHQPQPGNKPLPQLPRALVISGLENAGASSQRALAQVLSEKSVRFDSRDGRRLLNTHQDGHDPDADDFEGLWNLPDGFIVVYVCPIEPSERPKIHKSLLDNFAMSCNVLIKPGIRNAFQSIPFSPLRSNSVTQTSNPSTPLPSPHMSLPPTHSTRPPQLHQPRSSSSHFYVSPPLFSDPPFPPARIQALHQACTNKAHLSPLLSLYLADLLSATRHHPQLDGSLLTARCVGDAEKLAKAARVVGMDPTGVELLRGEEGGDEDQGSNNNDESDSENLQKGRKKGKGKAKTKEQDKRMQMDVTEVDIARMFPRCVSHRLRVRDGPREEVLAGAVFGATFGEEGEDVDGESRPSVKDILVSIMAEV